MSVEQRQQLRSLEGRRVSLALRGGTRLDDCQLVSAGRGHVASLWVFTNGADAFVDGDLVIDIWECV